MYNYLANSGTIKHPLRSFRPQCIPQLINSNLQVFGKACPLLDHCLDRCLLLLAGRPQKLSVVLEDAGKVVSVRHQLTADVWHVEESTKGEVVAAGGKKISECWSHLPVVF